MSAALLALALAMAPGHSPAVPASPPALGPMFTIAGSGGLSSGVDGGAATDVALQLPLGIAVGADGAVLVADSGASAIRLVVPDGRIATVAGTGDRGFDGDGASAVRARLSFPGDVAALADGGFLIALGQQPHPPRGP